MSNTQQQPNSSPSQEKAQRDSQGRFTKGNGGGPGNPYSRRVAELRKVVLECFDDQSLQEIIYALIFKARQGDLGCAKLLLPYVLGKPAPFSNPDQQDLQEFEQMKQDKIMLAQIPQAIDSLEPHLTLQIARTARAELSKVHVRTILEKLKTDNTKDKAKKDPVAKRNNPNSPETSSPLPNGVFGDKQPQQQPNTLTPQGEKTTQNVQLKNE